MKPHGTYRAIGCLVLPCLSILLLSAWQGCASSREEIIEEAATRYPYPPPPAEGASEEKRGAWLASKTDIDAKREEYIADRLDGGISTLGVVGLAGISALAVYVLAYVIVGSMYMEGDEDHSARPAADGSVFRF